MDPGPFKTFFLEPPTDFRRSFSAPVDIRAVAPPCRGVGAKLSSREMAGTLLAGQDGE